MTTKTITIDEDTIDVKVLADDRPLEILDFTYDPETYELNLVLDVLLDYTKDNTNDNSNTNTTPKD